MAGRPASRTFRRTMLAFGLCLLVFVFAIEAKTAWFNPAGASGSEIAAAKARPADLPSLVAHGVPVPDPVHPQIFFIFLTVLTAASLWKADALPGHSIKYSRLTVSSAAYFSPKLFFRPPPIL